MYLRALSFNSFGLSARRTARLVALSAGLLFTLAACQKSTRTSDQALKPIQAMLDSQIPSGTPQPNVSLYLSTQGYPEQPSQEPGTIVAIIRKIDMQTMEPVTARVTFYFDARGRLNAFELKRTPNQRVQ